MLIGFHPLRAGVETTAVPIAFAGGRAVSVGIMAFRLDIYGEFLWVFRLFPGFAFNSVEILAYLRAQLGNRRFRGQAELEILQSVAELAIALGFFVHAFRFIERRHHQTRWKWGFALLFLDLLQGFLRQGRLFAVFWLDFAWILRKWEDLLGRSRAFLVIVWRIVLTFR